MRNTELLEALEIHRTEYLKLFTDLVSIDTQTIGQGIGGGNEVNGQRYLERVLREMGAKVQTDPILEETILEGLRRYDEGNPGHNNEGRYNLIATFPGRGASRSLLFNGHMDTMPAGDHSAWETPPLTATERGGRYFGLGTSDMKAGLAAAVCAVRLLRDAGIPLPGPVRIVSVVDEEGGGNGSLSATMHGYNADAAVICEPTDCKITTANMGFAFFSVKVVGRSLHSGMKWLGVNAIDKAIHLMEALPPLEARWGERYQHPQLPAPSINVGVIRGGSAGSAVPGECEFKLCLHYIPHLMSYQDVYRDVMDALTQQAMGDDWLREHPPEIQVYQKGGGFDVDPEHPFVQSVRRACEAATGRAELTVSCTGNDARFYQRIAGIPTVILGPGHAGKGHRPNEYIEIENFYRCILSYAHLILEWCR